jgi:branched-chain amino acid transport system permease protein
VREALQFAVSGLTLGAIYALLSLGWVLVRRVSGLLFFVAGSLAVLGALLATVLVDERGWSLLAAVLAVVAVAVGVMLLVDLLLIARMRRPSELSEAIVLLGLSILLDELMRVIFGGDARQMRPLLPTDPLLVDGVSIAPQQLAIIGTTVVLVAALTAASHGLLGRAMLACAENPVGASLVGISPRKVRTAGLCIGGALAAAAGVLLAPLAPVAPASGLLFSVKGFIAAALGGWSFTGAVVAGAMLGLAEAFGAGYLSSDWKDIVSVGLLLVVLVGRSLARPRRRDRRPRRDRRAARPSGGVAPGRLNRQEGDAA